LIKNWSIYFLAVFLAALGLLAFLALGLLVFLVVALALVAVLAALGLAVFLGPAFLGAAFLAAFFAFYRTKKKKFHTGEKKI